MKKSFCTLMLSVLLGSSASFAQNKVVQVNSSSVTLTKPLVFNKTATISAPIGSLTIDLPACNFLIVNAMNNSSTIQTTEPSALNPNLFDHGYIAPEKANFMDLGTSTLSFRTIYSKSNVSKNNQSTLSDGRYKENIKTLKNASDKIMALRAVSFDLKATEDDPDTTGLKNKVGFIAQEMSDVLPHSVGYIPEIDMYTVDYTSIIPYLVQAFQTEHSEKEDLLLQMDELQNQVTALQDLVKSLLDQNENVNTPKSNTPKHDVKNGIKTAKLFQNIPNPFSEKTVIRYELPQTAGNAYLQVFDMGGRMLQNIQLPHQEIGQVEISAGELIPGTYTYNLVVSGKVIDSKRMVVTQ